MARIGRALGRVLQGGPVFKTGSGQTLGSYGPTIGVHAPELLAEAAVGVGPYGTPVLDRFDRANSSTLGANWSPIFNAEGYPDYQVLNQQASPNPQFNSDAWNVQAFGPDCEVFATIPNVGNQGELLARFHDPIGTTRNGYGMSWDGALMYLYRYDAGTEVAIGGGYTQAVHAGDRVALACRGNQIEVWIDVGNTGNWVKVAAATDSTYSASGYIGIYSRNNAAASFDDFGGGMVQSFTAPPIAVVRSAVRQRLLPTRPTVGGIGPPLLGTRAPTYQQTSISESLVRSRPRAVRSRLPLVIGPKAAQTFTGPGKTLVRARPRLVFSKLPVVVPTRTQPAPPLNINCLPPDRLARRYHRAPPVPGGSVFPPTVLQTFSGPKVTFVRTRPRRFAVHQIVPATLEPESVAIAEREPRVVLTRTRPRRTVGTRLAPPVFYPATSTVATKLVRSRPRPTRHILGPLIFYPATSQLRVAAVRASPRPTTHILRAPVFYPVADTTLLFWKVAARPRHTTRFVAPPATLTAAAVAFSAAKTPLVRIRPRHTLARLAPPATLEPEPVALAERTLRVVLTRTRPRPTRVLRRGLIFLPATSAISVHIVRARSKPLTRLVAAPATLQPYSVIVAEDTIRVAAARTRPRRITSRLAAPTALQVFAGPAVKLVRTRPRPTTKLTAPPVTGTAAAPAFYGPQVTSVAVRTRRDWYRHYPLPGFEWQLVRETGYTAATSPLTRVGGTSAAATSISIPAGTQPGDIIVIWAYRDGNTTPPTVPSPGSGVPTFTTIDGPTGANLNSAVCAYAIAAGGDVSGTWVNATGLSVEVWRGVAASPIGGHAQSGSAASSGGTLAVPAITQQDTSGNSALLNFAGWRTVTAWTAPPAGYTQQSQVATECEAVTKDDTTSDGTFNLSGTASGNGGYRTQQVELLAGVAPPTNASFIQMLRLPNLGPKPPLVIDPSPIPEIVSTLTAVRTRVETQRRAPYSKLSPPITAAAAAAVYYGPTVELRRIRPLRTHSFLAPPATLEPEAITLAEREIRTILVHARPRRTQGIRLAPPVFYPATSRIRTLLTRTRSKALTRFVKPPATLTPYVIEVAEETIRTVLTRTRPRPTTQSLAPPVVLRVFEAPATPLIHTRPRPTRWFLSPPATLEPEPVALAERQIRVLLVRTRPQPTVAHVAPPTTLQTFTGPTVVIVRTRPPATDHRLAPPTVIRVPSVEQAEDTITTRLVRTRPRPTTSFIVPPVVKTFPPVVLTLLPAKLTRTRPRPTRKHLGAPTVVIPPPSLRAQTITVKVVRTRPRPTTRRLAPPVFYRQATTIRTRLTRTRPRPTRHFLAPPVRYAQTGELAITLVRARPRPTTRRLAAPIVLRKVVFAPIRVLTVRVRPRPTTNGIFAPTALEPTETTLQVVLTRTRPRPTTRRLGPPTIITPPPSQSAQTIHVTVTRTRPRPTRRVLSPPAVIVTSEYGWTTGETFPAADTSGLPYPAAHTSGEPIGDAYAEGQVTPVAQSDGEDVPTGRTEGMDKLAGT